VRWLNEQSLRSDKQALRYLNQHLADKMLDEINRHLIEKIKAHKLSTGSKNSTVNRTIAVLRGILIAAHREWEWLDYRPVLKLLPVKDERVRWLTHEEVARLFAELPPLTKAMAQFSLATGLRASNVIHLKWSNVNMQKRAAWIDASETKSGKALAVPLNDDALSALRSQLGKHEISVFTYEGNPVNVVGNETWRKALKRAGIENFRYHDLRHTWASWHVQNGTPLHVLKELGGWSDLTMVLRYAHLSSENLSGYANNSKVNDEILSYPQKSPIVEMQRKA
jgi:integrase